MTVWLTPVYHSIRTFQIHCKECDWSDHLMKRTPRKTQNMLGFFPGGFKANFFLMNKLVLRLMSKVRAASKARARQNMLFVNNQRLVTLTTFPTYQRVFFTMVFSMYAFKARQ